MTVVGESADGPYPGETMDDYWLNAIWSVSPTILIGVLFWVVMRAVIRSDRNERAAYAKIEAEERRRLGLDSTAT